MPLHALILPSFYPTLENPLDGIFFKEQALMLKESGMRIGVIYPEIRPLKMMHPGLLLDNHFQCSSFDEDAMATMRLHGWNLSPGYFKGAMRIWKYCATCLFKKYINLYGLPQLIHAHSALWAGAAARNISERYGIPFIVTEHRDCFLYSDENLPLKNLGKWLHKEVRLIFEQSSQVVTVSNKLQQGIAKLLSLEIAGIEVIPNFVDQEQFTPLMNEKPKVPFIFLTVAHLVKSKNIQCLLYAFKSVIELDPQMRLKIAGDGPERKFLEKIASQLNIGAYVEFLGILDRSRVKKAYDSAHAFVLPSNYETFGVVFIEALSMGIPVIGTRCGGPEDIITPEAGILVQKNAPLDLTHAMLSLKKNYAQYPPDRLRNYAIQKFGKENISRQLMNLYSRVVKVGS